MSRNALKTITHVVLCCLMFVACMGAILPGISSAQTSSAQTSSAQASSPQEEKILLLSFQLGVSDGAAGESELREMEESYLRAADDRAKTPSEYLVRNLVLYLYTPLGSRPIIERAAITINNSSELGSEVQELTEVHGATFHRDDFLSPESWLRDVNFDGYSDLILPMSGSLNRKGVYLYNSRGRTFRPDFDGEYLAEPRIVKSTAFNHHHSTLLR